MLLTNNQIEDLELTAAGIYGYKYMLYSYQYKHIYNVDTMSMLNQYNIRTTETIEKPQQNTVKNYCEKTLNATAKPKQNHSKTNKEYAEGMTKTQLKMKSLYQYM